MQQRSKSHRTMYALTILYVLLIAVGGRLVFAWPDRKYMGILNNDSFYMMGCAWSVLGLILICTFLRTSKIRKLLFTYMITLIIFGAISAYYYNGLPKYTYEQAADAVAASAALSGQRVQLQLPRYRSDMLAIGSDTSMKTTSHSYYIYLLVDGKQVAYRFSPLSGACERLDHAARWPDEFISFEVR
ncbi:hypothetical protein M6D81_18730 [Paenibacillus sp. J5C_2022]|uniref:hypothetical protein n=1 Tax=Paenibacillus sp. J5C2022 TaxID=2977129 RepID=UPI0021CE205F|nr:hypothetical protein [Paenibacillus sp. J5C2022]MCU6710730.1 hypothetical protein [Paenibacillus sp. J5C2022]